MNEQYDAIVIGAGIIGTCTAFQLAKQGYKTLCVDKLPASGYGSTSGSCAIIRPYYSTVEGSALAYESHFYWKNWSDYLGIEDEKGNVKYNNCGCLVMKTAENKHLEPAMRIMETIGCPYQEMSADQVRSRLPLVNMKSYSPAKPPEHPDFGKPNGGTIGGAVFFPSGGYISDPQLSAHNVQRAAESIGVEFAFNTAVADIHIKNGAVCGLTFNSDRRVQTGILVNVAGPHSSLINKMAGVLDDMKISTRALRHEVAHIAAPDDYDFEHDGCVLSDNDSSDYFRPEIGNHILVGSEDPPCDEQQWVDPDNFDRNFSDHWNTLVLRAAQRISSLKIPNRAKGVVELYDVTEDWIPIYDKSSVKGYYMACGTSGNQFKNAPIAGEMMAQLIYECERGRDHDTDPVHFYLRNIDYSLNMGFFSRNRAINPDSSFSVLG